MKLCLKKLIVITKKCRLFPVIKTHRIVRNNEPVMNKSKILNEKSKDTIKAFHFLTLFTEMPRNKLLKVMKGLVDFGFVGSGNTCVNKKASKKLLKICEITVLFCFFVLNFHVEYNSRSYVFLWVGSDPALFMFNMFFCYYEDKGIRKTRKKVSFYRK